jgi:DHA1 family multidrug resistance protein-like MFS transporter
MLLDRLQATFLPLSGPEKRIYYVLFLSIFSTVTGVGIVVPLLPVYAHDLGASGLYISLIFGAFSLSRTCFLPYFGRLSDRKGRKPFIVAGLFAYALISVAFILSRGVSGLIGIRFIQGIASAMIMPVTQAYVGDITPPGREGAAMGLFNLSTFLGLSLGPLIGGVVSDHYSLAGGFVCMGLLALTGGLLSFCLLPPTRSEQTMARQKEPTPGVNLFHDREILGLFGFRFAYTTCIGIIWCFLPILADSTFGLSGFQIGLLIMLGVFVSGITNAPMGVLADRVDKVRMTVVGGGLVVIAMGLFLRAEGFWSLFWINILFGLGGGISMPPVMALAVTKGREAGAMGSIMAVLTMAHSVGMLAGSLIAGVLMDVVALRFAVPVGAVVMVLGVIVFVASFKNGSVRRPGGFPGHAGGR